MIEDIFNKPVEIEIGENTYQMEFDNKAYAQLESITGKGIFKLFNMFITENNLSFAECVELVCAGLLKHHDKEAISVARGNMEKSPWSYAKNIEIIQYAFAAPMLPPEIAKEVSSAKKPEIKKKTQKKK